jgi:hypothetical protein
MCFINPTWGHRTGQRFAGAIGEYRLLLDPDIVWDRASPAVLAGVNYTARFNEHDFAFSRCEGLVLYALWNHKHFSRFELYAVTTELNSHFALEDNEYLVCMSVAVPDKLALNLRQFELVIVHLSHNLRRPLIREFGEFVAQIDSGVIHGI